MKLQILRIIIALTLTNCSQRIKNIPVTSEGVPVVDLCELPNFLNQKVFLKATYSGIDEYWSLGSLKSKKCSNELRTDLDFISDYRMTSEFENMMTEISNDYMNNYLII